MFTKETKATTIESAISHMEDIIFEYDIRRKKLFIFNAESSAAYLFAKFGNEPISLRDIIPLIHPEERSFPAAAVNQLTRKNHHISCDCRICRINGTDEYRWYHISLNGIYSNEGRLVHITGIATDFSETHAAGLKWKSQAYTDSLTGIGNRARAKEVIESYLSESRSARGIFALIDLDGFKLLNDTKGHIRGDKALQETAALLKNAFRENDLVCRFGGDEFIVFAFTAAECAPICAKILSVGQKASAAGYTKLSAGLVRARRQDKFDTLYEKADKALYAAKEAGKGICRVYGE